MATNRTSLELKLKNDHLTGEYSYATNRTNRYENFMMH